jgi:hypothetical protein
MLATANGMHVFKETFRNSEAKFVEAGFAVGIDRFLVRHFSIGLDLGASYSNEQGYGVNTFQESKSTSISGGARLGYDVPLGQRFSWYPRLTLGLSRTHNKTTMSAVGWNGFPSSSVASSIGPVVSLYAPLLLHLAPHLFVGFGPRLAHSFGAQRGGPYDGAQSTVISGDFVLGGWWGERSAQPDSSVHTAGPDHAPFGQRGQTALGLATDASLSHFTDSASKSSHTDANFTPSADYFVLDHLSIGVNAFISHSSGTARDANDTPTDYASTSTGIGPRIGSSVSIAKWGTFWPQVELGYGTLSRKVSSREGTNRHFGTRSWLRLSAPVLFDVTSHFLLGAGPYFFYEISNADQYGAEHQAESVGARLLIVGWF